MVVSFLAPRPFARLDCKNVIKKGNRPALTLVEMLVTLAVIAIVAGAVIVSINPVAKIRDAVNTRAKQDVNTTAKVVESCLVFTSPSTNRQNTVADCDTQSELMSGGFARSVLSNGAYPNFQLNANAAVVCISQQGESSIVNWKYYTADQDGYTAGTLYPSLSPCLAGK